MDAKRAAIKQAYEKEGFDWNYIESFVDQNGYAEFDIFPEFNYDNFLHFDDGRIIPLSIQNIENNNHWKRLDEVFSMPKKNFFCYVILKSGKQTVAEYVHTRQQFCILRKGYVSNLKISHYSDKFPQKKPYY